MKPPSFHSRPSAPCWLALSLLLPLLFGSCRHRDFCLHDPELKTAVRISLRATYRHAWEIPVDPQPFALWRSQWPSQRLDFAYDDLLPSDPEGLRVIAYPEGAAPELANLPPAGGDLYFSQPGAHQLLMFNNDTEFIQFLDLETYATTRATTRSRYRSSYAGNPYYVSPRADDPSETTVAAPDMIYGAYISHYDARATTSSPPVLEVELQPLVFTYVVHYGFEYGLDHVKLARGALAGMASGAFLTSGTTTPDAVTILYDCQITPSGILAIVKSFGIPGYPKGDYSRAPGQFALNLELCLTNGKVVQHSFDVSEQVSRQPRGGVILIDGLRVEDADAASYGSGFAVDVVDWGQDTIITI